MNAVLSNKNCPHYGVATIPIPIPKEEYDHTIAVLEALEIGSAVSSDCMVKEIRSELPILKRLEGSCVNLDELDYLVKRLDSFDKRELAQFGALTASQNICEIADFINLTFCCQGSPIVQDFTDLDKTGRFCYMERNGGGLLSDEQGLDFRKEALNLILNEDGKVTPYGVIYDSGFRMEQLYDGQHFPQYRYEDCVMEVEVTSAEVQNPMFICLPMSDLQLERAMLHGGFADTEELQLRFLDSSLPEEADAAIHFEQESIGELNELCRTVAELDAGDLKKLGAVVCFAKPSDAAELCHLAEQLDLFDFVPDISTPKEYGQHMICESGHFEYDENLEGYYDFEKYGKEHMEQEDGAFNHRGYVSYQGFVSMEEVLEGVPSARLEQGMGGMA